MKLPKEIEDKLDKLNTLCNKYKVQKIFVFGSITNGNFNPQTSDIDLIVEVEDLPPSEKGELLMKLWSELEKLFERKVDLLTNLNIKNPYLKRNIENSKYLLYDRAG
ncbi:MAG: DNA polymerase subunit beta [Bacteroidetes bacterium]|nr:MAG: DNA polymerase subunit beta [Bacteroidota bacterium]